MTDVSKMSDAELMAALRDTPAAPAHDLSHMSDDDLLRALNDAPPSVAKDVAKAIPSGLAKGAASALGIVGDAADGLGRLSDYIGGKVASAIGFEPHNQVANPIADAIGSRSIRQGIEHVTGPLYEPQTMAGKFAGTASEFIPGALAGGGGMLSNAIRFGILPGLASEAAGQATEGTALEPWARAGTAIATGGVAALAQRPNTVGQTIAEGVQGLPKETLNAAFLRMDQAAKQGVPITWAEAIAQETGGASTRLSNIARVVEESGEGSKVMGPFFAERPGQVRAAGEREINALAPGAERDPVKLGLQAQDAADQGLKAVRAERSAATEPHYRAAADDLVPADRMEAVIAQLDDMIAKAPTPELAAPAQQIKAQLIETQAKPAVPSERVPVTDPKTGNIIRYEVIPGQPGSPAVVKQRVGDLDAVYGQARDDFTGPAPLGETGSAARARRSGGQAAGLLDTELQAASPSLREGRRVHAEMSDSLVNPVEAGPLGQIAKSEDVGAQTGALFPSQPQAGSSVPVADAVRRLADKDPRAAMGLVRQHAMTTFAEATQNNMGGANQAGGAKFAAQVAGNPEQMASLKAAVEALPGGAEKWQGFSAFLDTMEATGKRLPSNSATANKLEVQGNLKKGGVMGETANLAAGGLLQLPKRIREAYQDYRYGLNTEQIARVLVDPLVAPMLQKLATEPRGSALATQIVGRLATIAVTARDPFAQSGR